MNFTPEILNSLVCLIDVIIVVAKIGNGSNIGIISFWCKIHLVEERVPVLPEAGGPPAGVEVDVELGEGAHHVAHPIPARKLEPDPLFPHRLQRLSVDFRG